MRIDLMLPEVWEDLNDKLFSQLALPERTSLKCYRGLAHAIFEACEGASNFFSHKRSMGIVKGQTPIFNSLLPGFYKDSYQVQTQSGWPKGNEKAWVDSLKKDTNFVLFSSDHPVTGELYPWDELDALLNEKKIFSLRVSHSDWLRDFKNEKKSVRPYSIHFVSVGPDLALAIGGEKIKFPSVVASQMPWLSQSIQDQVMQLMGNFEEDSAAILDFEQKLPAGWLPLFSHQMRLFDRSLIYHTEVHGESMIQELAKLTQNSLAAPGESGLFETTNLGRWHSIMSYYDWWEAGLSPEILRGLIAIDARVIKSTPGFSGILDQAMKNLSV